MKLINQENTGLTSDAAVREVVRILAAAGHAVEFTALWGAIPQDYDAPEIPESEWFAAVEAADREFPVQSASTAR